MLMLFNDRRRFKKYLYSILIAVPVWFVVGILIGVAPAFAKALGMKEAVDTGRGVMFAYIGISFGDFLSGTMSQIFRTRKKIVYLFLTLTYLGILYFLLSEGLSADGFYTLCLLLGIATVTTTAPNFVRGSLILVTLLFTFMTRQTDIVTSGLIVGSLVIFVAYFSLWNLDETYGKDLDYLEESGDTGL
jgi:hypothetical protein